MKRVLSALLVSAMAISLCSCSSTADVRDKTSSSNQSTASAANLKPESGASLTVWAPADQKDWINYVGAQFKTKYGVPVTFKEVSEYTVTSKIQNDAPSGLGPDCFVTPHDQLGTYVASGLVDENNNTVNLIKQKDVPAAIDASSMDGKVYGYPLDVITYVLAYNKKLVTKVPETFDDIKTFAKTFNDPTQQKYAFIYKIKDPFFTTCFVQGYGGYYFGNNNKNKDNIGLNSKGAVAGLKFFQSMKDYCGFGSEIDNNDVFASFQQAKSAMMLSNIYAIQQAEKQNIEVGVAPLPKMANGKRPVACSTVHEMFVSKYAKYPQAAKLFAAMASSDEMLLKKSKMQDVISVSKDVLNSSDIKNDTMLSAFSETAKTCITSPSISQMSYVWNPYEQALAAIWDNKADVQKTMDNCVNTIKQQIQANQ